MTLNGEEASKDLLHWINDGLMAIFFFLVGLELKREMLEGKLKTPRDVVLPASRPSAAWRCRPWSSCR